MKLSKEDLILILELIDSDEEPSKYKLLRQRIAEQLYKLTV